MFEKQKKALLSHLSEGVVELFKEKKVMIAGGAITSVFTNKEVNDVDVYFRSYEDLIDTVDEIFNKIQQLKEFGNIWE